MLFTLQLVKRDVSQNQMQFLLFLTNIYETSQARNSNKNMALNTAQVATSIMESEDVGDL